MPSEVDQASAPNGASRSGAVHRLLTVVFSSVFALLLRLVCASNRLTTTGADVFDRYVECGGNIFAFWHNRLFYLTYYYVKRSRGHKATMLVSLSRDGDYGVALVRKFRQEVVRGSTSRGGRRAVSALVRTIAAGKNVAITPDGPRGPACKVNEGTIKLAQITGARIIPVSFDASRKRPLKSWDRFIMVRPFGRVHVAFGTPIEIPRRITAADRERYCAQLQQRLLELDRICAESLTQAPGATGSPSQRSHSDDVRTTVRPR